MLDEPDQAAVARFEGRERRLEIALAVRASELFEQAPVSIAASTRWVRSITLPTRTLIGSSLRRLRNAVPAELDLPQQRDDFLQQVGTVLEVRPEQRARRVVVQPLEVLCELSAPI